MSAPVKQTLDEVAQIIMGQSPPSSTYNNQGNGLPFFQGKAQFGEVSPTPDTWCSEPARVAEAGDILVSVRAPVGPTNRAVERCCIGRGLAAIRTNSPKLDQNYLHWFMRFAEPMLARKGSGSTFHAVGRKEIASLRITLPPIDEQQRIVALLDRAAEIRRRADAARAKARALIPALFLDTFGDPAANPKGWPITELGQVANVQGGLQVTKARQTLPVELPYLRVANVMRGSLDLREIKLIRMTDAERQRTELRYGDVLVVEGHGNPNEIGRAAVWNGFIAPCTHQNHLIRVRPDTRQLKPQYLETYLNSESGRSSLIRSGKTTSGLNTISTRNVKVVRLPIPPIQIQAAYAERVIQVEALTHALDAAAAKAETMAAALAAELFDARPAGDETGMGQNLAAD